ncbi:MAG: nucleotidyltransferase family protein [bacterium]|nr:nucleotidyltransferase family protein [bacterium]
MKGLAIDRTRLVETCEHNDIAFLGVFGSFARGESRAESDVDLLVSFSRRKSLLDLVRIEREFTEVLRRTVDLVTEASISPYLRERIKAEVKVIYEQAR